MPIGSPNGFAQSSRGNEATSATAAAALPCCKNIRRDIGEITFYLPVARFSSPYIILLLPEFTVDSRHIRRLPAMQTPRTFRPWATCRPEIHESFLHPRRSRHIVCLPPCTWQELPYLQPAAWSATKALQCCCQRREIHCRIQSLR